MSWKPMPPPFQEFKKKVFEHASQVSAFIYQLGESPVLRKSSVEIPLEAISTQDMKRKVAYVKKCLLDYRKITGYGRGIAAVQVGITERFSVIYNEGDLLTIINPQITKYSRKKNIYPEICMSAYPIIAPIIRPAWVKFIYFDEKGEKHYWDTKDETAKGKIMNRVFQHEIDHMEGIITVDKVRTPKELLLESDPSFYLNAKFEHI